MLRTYATLVAVLAFLAPARAIACDKGHWVQAVSEDGEVVTLEDGTVWLVDALDRVDTALWPLTADIIVCDGQLFNAEDNESAVVRRVR
jgi:hypothetical protein